MIVSRQLVTLDASSITTVLRQWQVQWPGHGLLALLPEKEKDHVGILQAACAGLGVPLIGAIFPTLITDSGFQTEGAWLLCFETMPGSFLIEDIQARGGAFMAEAFKELLPDDAPVDAPRTLLAIFDSMVPTIGSLMDDLHQHLDAPPFYVGVNAGSETFQPMPCLFDGERLVGNGVLGVLLSREASAVVRHAYPVSRSLMRATSAAGNRIATIDDRPAFDVYQEVIGEEYGVALTVENFYKYAVHFPFGVVTAIDVLVRIPVALGDDGALFCVGEIPPNSMLRLLKAPSLADSTCVSTICESLAGSARPVGGLPMLTFYCAGRRMHFGDDAAVELAQLREEANSSALFGALSLGEIDSLEDFNFPRFHNAAIVCMPQGHG